MPKSLLILAFSLIVNLSSVNSFGQYYFGAIQGQVTDQENKGVPYAKLKANIENEKESQIFFTDSNGNYSIELQTEHLLQPNKYYTDNLSKYVLLVLDSKKFHASELYFPFFSQGQELKQNISTQKIVKGMLVSKSLTHCRIPVKYTSPPRQKRIYGEELRSLPNLNLLEEIQNILQ